MGWEALLGSQEERVLPWLGGRKVSDRQRTWTISGALPPEHGWYSFRIAGGRRAELVGPADPVPDFERGQRLVIGYLVGNRLIPDGVRVDLDPNRLVLQTRLVHLIEPGLERFCRVSAVEDRQGELIFLRQELPLGPEAGVQAAYVDRLESVDHVAGVTPALDLAFRFVSHERRRAEERRAELERQRLEEARLAAEEAALEAEILAEQERWRNAWRDPATGVGRRALAVRDFEAAARGALAVSGAELLDCRPSYQEGEMIVQYRYRERRLECVVDRLRLRVVDAGICLTDESTGERGDAYFTLESLPSVVGEAIDSGRLVVYRHVQEPAVHRRRRR